MSNLIVDLVTTVIANMLARKQKLVERRADLQDAEERDKIERQLEQIETALDFLGTQHADREP